MNRKKITIKPKSSLTRKPLDLELEERVDKWVMEGIPTSPQQDVPSSEKPTQNTNPEIEESRFTIVIPTYLHRRIKKYCAINGLTMKDVIFDVLVSKFPES